MKNIVYNCDCNDLMKNIDDNYYNLAICDPEYGIGFDKENLSMSCGMRKDGSKRIFNDWTNIKSKGYKTKNWDTKIPEKKYFDELLRISKYQIIWGGNYFSKYLLPSGGWIVWDKKNTMPTLSKGELAWTSCNNHLEIFYYLWAGYRKQDYEYRIHPTQKPVALYRWLLNNYAKPGDKIFDSHVGSGSSRIACYELGFDFEGCELDLDYYNDQEKRFMEFKKKFHNEFYIPEEENLLFK